MVMSPNYEAVAHGIRELLRLDLAGLDESPESNAVLDAMMPVYLALTDDERRQVDRLQNDLYSAIKIVGPPCPFPRF